MKNGTNGLPQGSGLYWKHGKICGVISHNGKRYPFATGTDNTKQALKVRDEKHAEILNSQRVSLARGVRIAELLEDYVENLESKEADNGAYMGHTYDKSSYKARTRINKHLLPHFGNLKPEDITTAVMKSYKAKRSHAHPSVATINSEFRILRAALRLGTKKRPRKVNPLHIPDFGGFINDRAEKKLARVGIITPEQYQGILEALADHLKPVFVTVYWTGIRSKEIKFVCRTNVNFVQNTITLQATETKSGDVRVAPMNEEVRAVLMRWEEHTQATHPNCKWVFHFDGEQIGNWKTAWNAALRRCGLRVPVEGSDGTQETRTSKGGKVRKVWKNLVKFHDTRRTMITTLDEAGIEERDTMAAAGHTTTSQNRRYNQSKAAAERIRLAQNRVIAERAGGSGVIAQRDGDDVLSRLEKLAGMFEKGMLTEQEFGAFKARMIA
jgi:hypothetical protein